MQYKQKDMKFGKGNAKKVRPKYSNRCFAHTDEYDLVLNVKKDKTRTAALYTMEDEEKWAQNVKQNPKRTHHDCTVPSKVKEFTANVGDEFVTALITKITYRWENNQLIPLNVEQEGTDYMPRIKQPSSRSHSAPQWKFKKAIEKVSYYGDEFRHTKVIVTITTWEAK